MVRINLLPWRQIKRTERQRQFILMLVATLIAGAVVVFLGHTYITNEIEHQESRNKRLADATLKLDKEIADIKVLKEQIQDVLGRKQVVENLQSNRGQAVALLDELARQLPEGMHLKTFKQTGNVIRLDGIADTNARVATLVRKLGISQWLESPELVEIKAETVNNLKQSSFTLNVKQKVQKAPDPAAKKG